MKDKFRYFKNPDDPPLQEGENISLASFLEREHPTIYREWLRFRELKWDDLQVGMEIQTLMNGHSGNGGDLRFIVDKVVEHNKEYILLNRIKSGRDRCSIISRDPDLGRRSITYYWDSYGASGTMRPFYWWQQLQVKDIIKPW